RVLLRLAQSYEKSHFHLGFGETGGMSFPLLPYADAPIGPEGSRRLMASKRVVQTGESCKQGANRDRSNSSRMPCTIARSPGRANGDRSNSSPTSCMTARSP